MKHLVLGGARSGKTSFGEQAALALASTISNSTKPIYLATAQAFDDEMRSRIARHQIDRAERFVTIEEPLELEKVLLALENQIVLIDCLTLWLTNKLLGGHEIEASTAHLCAAVRAFTGDLVVISNEVGWGIVPETPLGRVFRDAQGRLNQAMAQECDRVTLVVAGLPLILKAT